MAKRKRSRSVDYIEGLTIGIIRKLAKPSSIKKAESLKEKVSIDSGSATSVEATFGQHSVSIPFESPVRKKEHIEADCDCTATDYCIHICAVLLRLVDPQPNVKKKKNAEKPRAKTYSVSKLKKALDNLDKKQMKDVIDAALSYKCVQAILSTKLASIRAEPIDVLHYDREVSLALSEYSWDVVYEALCKITRKAERYRKNGNNRAALQIYIAVAEGVSSTDRKLSTEIEEGIHCMIPDDMKAIVEEDEDLQTDRDMYEAIQAISESFGNGYADGYVQALKAFTLDDDDD